MANPVRPAPPFPHADDPPAAGVLSDPARLHLLAETELIAASAAARLPTLDRVARLAARALRAPVAQVNLVTADAQVPAAAFVDARGAGPNGPALDGGAAAPGAAWRTPVGLDASYCRYAVERGRPVVVADATADPLVRDSRATREVGIRSYASAPVFTPGGAALGTVCVVDFRPREWSPADVEALEECATLAGEEVAARLGAAAALRESEERLRLALLAAQLGSWSLDLRTETLTSSARCRENFGRHADDPFTYADLFDAIHPDDRAGVRAAVARAVEGGADYAAEYRARTPDGGERWIAASGRALYTAAGAPLRIVGLTQDVTERHGAVGERERLLAAERAARVRVERVQALTAALAGAATQAEVCAAILREGGAALGAAAVAVALPVAPAGPDDRALTLELVAASGWPDEATAAWSRFPASTPAGGPLPPDVNSPIADAIRHGEPVWLEGAEAAVSRYPVLAPLVDLMRVRAWLAVPFTLVGDDAERRVPGGLIVVLRDQATVSTDDRDLLLAMGRQCAQALERARLSDAALAAAAERERHLADAQGARREAEAANRAKAEFLAVMSHELRTPLNAIGGYAELVAIGIHGPVSDGQRQALERIQASQRHLLGLINEVLNYAKLETGAVRYDLADVPLGEALVAAEALVAPQARAKALELVVRDCPRGVVARADAEKLRQVLVNLLSNAVKFTDARAGRPGRIELTCATEGGRAVVRVRDTGIGIPVDKLDAIFDPFVQVQRGLTRTAEGTGLGLAISRDLARGMGGELTVESTPGEGSTFTLALPRPPEA